MDLCIWFIQPVTLLLYWQCYDRTLAACRGFRTFAGGTRVESERQFLSAKKLEEEFPLITFAAFPHPHPCNGLFWGCSPGYSFTFSLSPVRHTPFLALSIYYISSSSLIFSLHLAFTRLFPHFFLPKPTPKNRLPSHSFCIFPIWNSFYSLPFSVHMYISAGFPYSFLFYC